MVSNFLGYGQFFGKYVLLNARFIIMGKSSTKSSRASKRSGVFRKDWGNFKRVFLETMFSKSVP